MNDSKDHKAAAEPPLDCRVGQRIERYLRQLAPHQAEREGPKLLREAADEIKRNLAGLGDLARYVNHLQARIDELTDSMDFETKRLRRVAVLMGISAPVSDDALRAAAGGVLGEIERAIERSFKVPNAIAQGREHSERPAGAEG